MDSSPFLIENISTNGRRILRDIRNELGKAVAKHPNWPHNVFYHQASIVGEETGELMKALNELGEMLDAAPMSPSKLIEAKVAEVRKEAAQTAAMCIRILASIDEHCGAYDSV